jgi:hypothetical protein
LNRLVLISSSFSSLVVSTRHARRARLVARSTHIQRASTWPRRCGRHSNQQVDALPLRLNMSSPPPATRRRKVLSQDEVTEFNRLVLILLARRTRLRRGCLRRSAAQLFPQGTSAPVCRPIVSAGDVCAGRPSKCFRRERLRRPVPPPVRWDAGCVCAGLPPNCFRRGRLRRSAAQLFPQGTSAPVCRPIVSAGDVCAGLSFFCW